MTSFHPLFITKKEAQNGVVLNGTVGLLLPLDARSRGGKRYSSFVFHRVFFQKDTDQGPPLAQSFPRVGGKGG
jgi:hypothetical protein